ncbi:MAG: hypothetical protein ACP5NQ_06660, partial [Vulcanisaeta sp.]
LVKYIDYSSLVAGWNQSLIMGHSLSMRGIAMMWNWDDMVAWANWTGTYLRNLNTLIGGLHYLVSVVSGSPGIVRVLLDDASELSKLEGEKFDVIVTDPPYANDVPYSELSDFYYVWLKRALSDNDGSSLIPRFVENVFFHCLDGECSRFVEVMTQWEEFAPKEISQSEGRAKYFGGNVGSMEFFTEGLARSFVAMRSRLVDDGLLVTYYAHTSPEAWAALLYAGWVRGGFRVTAAYPMVTESAQRVIARGKLALDTSIVVVWRRGVGGVRAVNEALSEGVNSVVEEFKRRYSVRRTTVFGEEVEVRFPEDFRARFSMFIEALGIVLREVTKYERLIGVNLNDVNGIMDFVGKRVYPTVARALVTAFGVTTGAGIINDWRGVFYILTKVLTAPINGGRRGIDRNTAIWFTALGGKDVNDLIREKLVVRGESDLRLLEPVIRRGVGKGDIVRLIADLLSEKGINVGNPVFRSPVDVLHYLEYIALVKGSGEVKKVVDDLRGKTTYVDDALAMARILARLLPEGDVEKVACEELVKSLGG